MKFRLSLGLLALVAGLVFGMSALPSQAHAATPVAFSATELSAMQSVLDTTQVVLDTIQLQINRNEIQDRQATLANLNSIRSYLLNMRELLGGAPAISIEYPEPVALSPMVTVPQTSNEVSAVPAAPEPSGEVAGTATVNETVTPSQQAESAGTNETSKRAFWIILVTAVIIAIILAIPRKKEVVALQDAPQSAPQTPQPEVSEKPEPAQSA